MVAAVAGKGRWRCLTPTLPPVAVAAAAATAGAAAAGEEHCRYPPEVAAAAAAVEVEITEVEGEVVPLQTLPPLHYSVLHPLHLLLHFPLRRTLIGPAPPLPRHPHQCPEETDLATEMMERWTPPPPHPPHRPPRPRSS